MKVKDTSGPETRNRSPHKEEEATRYLLMLVCYYFGMRGARRGWWWWWMSLGPASRWVSWAFLVPATGEQEVEEGEDEAEPDRGDKEARRTERVSGRRWWRWWLLPGTSSDVRTAPAPPVGWPAFSGVWRSPRLTRLLTVTGEGINDGVVCDADANTAVGLDREMPPTEFTGDVAAADAVEARFDPRENRKMREVDEEEPMWPWYTPQPELSSQACLQAHN